MVADAVDYFPESGMASFSASDKGTLVYRSSSDVERSRLLWFDRKGNQTGEVMEPAPYRNPRLSPDGKRLAVEQIDPSGNRDIYIIDLEKRLSTRITFDPGIDAAPVWSNDGLRFAWYRGSGVYAKLANGTGQEERIHADPLIPDDWEPGGLGLAGSSQCAAVDIAPADRRYRSHPANGHRRAWGHHDACSRVA